MRAIGAGIPLKVWGTKIEKFPESELIKNIKNKNELTPNKALFNMLAPKRDDMKVEVEGVITFFKARDGSSEKTAQ